MATRVALVVVHTPLSRSFTTRAVWHAAGCCNTPSSGSNHPPKPCNPVPRPCNPPTKIPCCPKLVTHPCDPKPCPVPADFVPREPTPEALEVVYNCQGDPSKVLNDRRVENRRPLETMEVLVQMLLAPVTPLDLDVISGKYVNLCPTCKLPAVGGNEGVGQVLEVGCGVKTLLPGNIVIPKDIGFGTWRTQVICYHDQLICLPSDITFVGAAHISVAPSTAWRLLKGIQKLCPCDIIIQSAANSAVGQAVIQLCKKWDIHTVNVVRDRPDVQKLKEYLTSIGGTHVITDKFLASTQMCSFVKGLKKKPKMAIDCVGGKVANDLATHLECGAAFASYGDITWDPCTFNPRTLHIRYIPVKVYGFWTDFWKIDHPSVDMEVVITEMCNYIRSGHLKPPQHDILSFLQYRKAVARAKEQLKPKRFLLKMDDNLRIPPCEFCYQNVEHRICKF